MEISSKLATAYDLGLQTGLVALNIVVLNADRIIKFHSDVPSGEICELSVVKNVDQARNVLCEIGLEDDPTDGLFILLGDLVPLEDISSKNRHQIFNRLSHALGIESFGPWDTMVGLMFALTDANRRVYGNQQALEAKIKDHIRVEILKR
jgi:hypothetical protein